MISSQDIFRKALDFIGKLLIAPMSFKNSIARRLPRMIKLGAD
jgi:hypothetical protein